MAAGSRAGEVAFEEGIEFSDPDGQHLKLNLARPKVSDSRRGAVLCIHGGGWRGGNRDRWNELCKKLAERGYVAATASYRLMPKYRFPDPVHDLKAAVRWLRASAGKYNIDPARIGVLGDSAGGHLAQLLGVTPNVAQLEGDGGNPGESSAVACVVNYYGPTDLTKAYEKPKEISEVVPMFVGGDPAHAWRNHVLASPLYWVTPQSAPTLLLFGTDDELVDLKHATWMYDRLKAADVAAELVVFQGAGHGFRGGDALAAEAATLAFLDKHLKPSD